MNERKNYWDGIINFSDRMIEFTKELKHFVGVVSEDDDGVEQIYNAFLDISRAGMAYGVENASSFISKLIQEVANDASSSRARNGSWWQSRIAWWNYLKKWKKVFTYTRTYARLHKNEDPRNGETLEFIINRGRPKAKKT